LAARRWFELPDRPSLEGRSFTLLVATFMGYAKTRAMKPLPSQSALLSRFAAALSMLLAAVNDPSAQTGAEPAAAAAASFGVAEYRVLGNAVLPATDIERVLYPLLGEQKTLDDVEKARAALEALYRERGYGTVFVDIPEQNVDEGIVRLHVTEGTIARVRVAGARYFSNREIRAAVPAAAPGSVPHLPTVQKQLAALNAQTPDRSVVPVLKAGPRPGTVDLALNVTDNVPAHLTTEINDQYTSNTSRLRASVAVNYDNLFDRLDSIALQYQTSPQEPAEVSVWAGSYILRLPESAAKVALFYIDSNSDVATVGDAGASVSVLGKGKIFGARYIDPFYTAADATHVFIGSAEYKDFAESVFASDFLRTPISYLNFAAGHTSAWRLDKQQWTLANTVNFGARGVSNSEEEFRLKRARGIANYWFLRSDVGWSMTLPWTLNLRVRGSGQYAVDPTISNEQFSIAGADGVRGYREAEQLGDVGVKTSFEFGSSGWNFFAERLQTGAFIFYDFGRMTRLEPLRDGNSRSPTFGRLLEEPDRTLRSAGAGFEFAAFEHFSGAITWAYPFVDGSNGGTREGDSRIHFSFRGSW